MPVLPEKLNTPKVINKVALSGLNTWDDPKDIADQECADILNMVFDEGMIKPRGGSYLYRAKPALETDDPFQMLVATTSDGIDYLIANYGVNFYLDDTINNQWIWLNPSGGYIPYSTGLYYGTTPWNQGIADDRFYFCNGTDPVIKWYTALDTLHIATVATDTTLTLNDAIRFPQSGSLVVKGTTGEFILKYSTKSGNVLNLVGTVGQIVPIGSSVTIPIVSVPEIDQSQNIANDATPFGTNDSTTLHNKVAQSFVASKDTVEGFIFNKQSDTGVFLNDVKFSLRTDSGGSPSSTILQSKTIDNADWIGRNLGLQGINFRTNEPISFLPSPQSAGLNDMTQSGNFSGTQSDEFRVIIDSVADSGINNLVFNGLGGDVLLIDSSGYTGGSSNTNQYRLFITEPGGFPQPFGYELYKNGTLVDFGPLQAPGGVGFPLNTTYDGINFNIPVNIVGSVPPAVTAYSGSLQNGMVWTLNIRAPQISDTFQWFKNDLTTPVASGVAITGSDQTLANGISIKFEHTTGHTYSDSWDFYWQYNKVTIGNTYWLVFETTKNDLPAGDTNNHPNIGINTAGGYASGLVKYDNTSDGWITIPTIDLYFFILSTPFIPRGKILKKSQGRLFLFNSVFNENAFNYSQINDPENFEINDTANTGGFYTVYHGKGGIVDVNDFGEYLLIEKENDLLKCMFLFDSTNTNFIVQITPVISGESIGPVSNATALNYMNNLYYVTNEEGIIEFTPEATGGQTTSTLNIISQKINNYVTRVLDFENSRCAGWNQKLFWVTAVPLLKGLPKPYPNNGVIMYDLIRQAWTRFDNWNCADIKPVNNTLYYFSLNDGAIYQCFVDFQDAANGNPLEYTASFSTKRFDLDSPELLSKEIYVYLQGYINLSSKFYVDILYNENGYLGKQTYLIDGSSSIYVFGGIQGGLGYFPFGIPLLGGFNLRTMQGAQNLAFFRVYLECSQAFRPHNIQVVCYSQDLGSEWGVNNITLITAPEKSIETQLVLSPTLNPPIVL